MQGDPKHEDELFHQLKEILLSEEHKEQLKIRSDVDYLSKEINDAEKLKGMVTPIIEERFEYMRVNFPKLYGEIITATIRNQIKNSQDEMVDVLYPIIGKLIRKFIIREFEQISEKIDRRMEAAFSVNNMINRVKYWFGGVDPDHAFMADLGESKVEEIIIIDKDSGLIIGSYSEQETIDRDMIAGMLSAIKSFVEDAFSNRAESLEIIEYETYKILLLNFNTYYIATIISGILDQDFRMDLEEQLNDFVQKYDIHGADDIDDNLKEKISENLIKHFKDFNVKHK